MGVVAIHGDLTVETFWSDGTPPRSVGLVDFGMAQLAPRLTDVAWCAWRGARRDARATTLEKGRLRALVAGHT
jgi:aminoglycoside phosphotransferase (APT) family kinase protein